MRRTILLCIPLGALLAVCSCQRFGDLSVRFPGPAEYPEWAAPVETPYTEGKPWQLSGKSRAGGAEKVRPYVGRLRYVVTTQPTSPDRPYLLLCLAEALEILDLDRLAFMRTQEIVALPDSTPHNAKLWGVPSLQTVQQRALLVQARLLARNGLAAKAASALDSAAQTNGYGALLRGFVLASAGDTVAAAASLADAYGGGHPDRGFSDIYLRMRAATLARAIGADALATTISEPILTQDMAAQKWPQWQAAWSILNTLKETRALGPCPSPASIPDGVYEGACRGFVGTVSVAVTLESGSISSVEIVRTHDDRPWSAFDIVPDRVEQANSLLVDAVTGATVSSCAVITAVDRALTRAASKR